MYNLGYVSIKIDADLMREVDAVLGKHGYKTRAEFVKDAVRRMLDEINSKDQGCGGRRL